MYDFSTIEVVKAKENLKSEIGESKLEGENTEENIVFLYIFLVIKEEIEAKHCKKKKLLVKPISIKFLAFNVWLRYLRILGLRRLGFWTKDEDEESGRTLLGVFR